MTEQNSNMNEKLDVGTTQNKNIFDEETFKQHLMGLKELRESLADNMLEIQILFTSILHYRNENDPRYKLANIGERITGTAYNHAMEDCEYLINQLESIQVK